LEFINFYSCLGVFVVNLNGKMATLPKKQLRVGLKKNGLGKMRERCPKNTGRIKGSTPAQKPDPILTLLRKGFGHNPRMAGCPRRSGMRNFRYATYRSDGDFTPEQRLWVGVLEQAVDDLRKKSPFLTSKGNLWQIRAKAIDWFKSESEETGTFYWVCDHLNIDQKAARQRLGVKT
jgi:hypothetical protein